MIQLFANMEVFCADYFATNSFFLLNPHLIQRFSLVILENFQRKMLRKRNSSYFCKIIISYGKV